MKEKTIREALEDGLIPAPVWNKLFRVIDCEGVTHTAEKFGGQWKHDKGGPYYTYTVNGIEYEDYYDFPLSFLNRLDEKDLNGVRWVGAKGKKIIKEFLATLTPGKKTDKERIRLFRRARQKSFHP